MPTPSQVQRQQPRGLYDLHDAVLERSTERTVALLARESIDIDRVNPEGCTALMLAALGGYIRVARILLNEGANVSYACGDACMHTALHLSAQEGHLAMSKMLIKTGANLDARKSNGSSPLFMAVYDGHSGVVRALTEAGANPNARRADGTTALYNAALGGHVEISRMLLSAKADPLLTATMASGKTYLPLDAAALKGHSDIVHELVERIEIKGCGGVSGGVDALRLAAQNDHVDILAILAEAGVVDSGLALIGAAEFGREASVKFLFQQRTEGKTTGGDAYANFRNDSGTTPVLSCVRNYCTSSSRIVRLLIDAGADTKSALTVTNSAGRVEFGGTPLDLANFYLGAKKAAGARRATEEELHRLKGIRRLLLSVDAVHSVAWLWPKGDPLPGRGADDVAGRTAFRTTPKSPKLMPTILRRRVARKEQGRLLAAFSRWVN